MFKKEQVLFIVLGGFFVANTLVAEFIGVKIYELEATLGIAKRPWSLFGIQGDSFQFTAGVLLWPIVFIMTDIINEYFGKKGVQLLTYLTVVLITYAFFMVYAAINLAPADWWVGVGAEQGVPDMQAAFSQIFGQGMWIIVASLVAFLIGQLIDVIVFQRMRRLTGSSRIYVRATVSTMVSQLIDSYVVLYIAFVLGPQQWPMNQFFAIGSVNYAYKVLAAIALIPLLYVIHFAIDSYLGKERAEKLTALAAEHS